MFYIHYNRCKVISFSKHEFQLDTIFLLDSYCIFSISFSKFLKINIWICIVYIYSSIHIIDCNENSSIPVNINIK